ncbi:hypothetical protein SAMN05192529_103149 [Arachidicoccus rhizosphaerae]|uniref:Uncharacterized protein n=1 Tax=Arachidicoccus rhizosphaerae TaxID=551991 RepID=A0A1H3WMG1_9BACT|nr:hypothetical protein [Arachidicoccus rhizosphaerae]SDZ88315.1 hypothetical protein SAMN05192529_103149 [Arachidicoccus rhizosphaerae]
MKKYLSKAGILLITLLTSGVISAQEPSIDQLDSDSAVLRYVKTMNYEAKKAPQWKFFYLTQGDEWASYFNFSEQQQASYQSQQQPSKWIKTDLNHDGKTDLLVSGYIAKKPGDWATATFKVLVFLSQPGKNYIEANILPAKTEKFPTYIQQINIKGNNYLKINHWLSQNSPGDLPFISDTTYYSSYWDVFLNYHQQGMRASAITHINYKAMEDKEGSYHALDIDLISGKKTNMQIIVKGAKQKEPDINRARLAEPLWVHMDTLIRSSYVTGIQKGDTTLCHPDEHSEALPVYLSITYADGHTETIQDYNSGATYSMATIYNCMESIIENVFAQLQRRQELMSSMISGAIDGALSF